MIDTVTALPSTDTRRFDHTYTGYQTENTDRYGLVDCTSIVASQITESLNPLVWPVSTQAIHTATWPLVAMVHANTSLDVSSEGNQSIRRRSKTSHHVKNLSRQEVREAAKLMERWRQKL